MEVLEARSFPKISGIYIQWLLGFSNVGILKWWPSGIFKCWNFEMLLKSVISEFPVSFIPEILDEKF